MEQNTSNEQDELQIKNTSNMPNPKIFGLIYGESGRGKTYAACTFDEPTLVVSCESGLLSLNGKNVDYIDCNSFSQLMKICHSLINKETHYKTIYFDSLTEISRLAKDQYGNNMNYQEWGKYTSQIEKWLRAMRSNKKYNIWITALTKENTNNNLNAVDIDGKKLSYNLFQFFDFVFSIHIKEDGSRVFATQEISSYHGKDRSRKLDPVEPADFSVIMNKINR